MITAGVDLAAQPAGTALCLIDWGGDTPSPARLVSLTLGVADAPIVAAAAGVEKLGIDCAFGWPDHFVEFVSGNSAGRLVGGSIGGEPAAEASVGSEIDDNVGGMEWRRDLAYRETDRRVRETTGRWPLSVSTDRLGLTAMRCAGLLARIAATGVPIDRAGAGLVVEIYPGATLRLWGFDTKNYRVDASRRSALVDGLLTRAPWLDLGRHEQLMRASTDAFDAVIACLAARAAALGHTRTPEPDVLAQARREGWVALPTCGLDALR